MYLYIYIFSQFKDECIKISKQKVENSLKMHLEFTEKMKAEF